MNQLNDTTRRYPRTLNEAFGPYAHHSQIYSPHDEERFQKEDRIVIAACVVGLIVTLGLALKGWL